MNVTFERTALSVCAISLSVLAIHAVTAHAEAQPSSRVVDELTVRRLKVVDASGALRLLLTGKPLQEGTIDGRVVPRPGGPRQQAGLVFYNDQGDEQGGLVYDGTAGEQSQSLTFDAWRQDQALAIQHSDDANGSSSYFVGIDRPKSSLYDAAVALNAARSDTERTAIEERLVRNGSFGRRRFLVGENQGNSDVDLRDARGRLRLQLRVTPDGDASIAFLDAAGKVTRRITAGDEQSSPVIRLRR